MHGGNYGITKQTLCQEVLAQSNSFAGSTTSGSSSVGGDGTSGDAYWQRFPSDCSIIVHGVANAEVTILGIKIKMGANGEARLTVEKAEIACSTGGTFQCKSISCADFWMSNGLGT